MVTSSNFENMVSNNNKIKQLLVALWFHAGRLLKGKKVKIKSA